MQYLRSPRFPLSTLSLHNLLHLSDNTHNFTVQYNFANILVDMMPPDIVEECLASVVRAELGCHALDSKKESRGIVVF